MPLLPSPLPVIAAALAAAADSMPPPPPSPQPAPPSSPPTPSPLPPSPSPPSAHTVAVIPAALAPPYAVTDAWHSSAHAQASVRGLTGPSL
eukprot:7385412-Prymnesium_polylepis.1